MARAVNRIYRANSHAIYEINPVLHCDAKHDWGNAGIICAISINQDVELRVYISKHPPDNIAFPLHSLDENRGTRRKRFSSCIV